MMVNNFPTIFTAFPTIVDDFRMFFLRFLSNFQRFSRLSATFNDFFLEDMLALVLWRLSNILGERSLAAMKLVGPDAAGDDAAGADDEEDEAGRSAARLDVSTF